MKAILLSAGEGTRLRPITNSTPKCLVKINGTPLLEIWIKQLLAGGITKILVNTHYLSNQVDEFIKNSVYSSQIEIVYEENLLGTAGTLIANKRFINDESFFVAHADNLTLFDLGEFIEAHSKRPLDCEMTMMLFVTDTPKTCGIVKLDEEKRVIEFIEKSEDPPSNLANAAVYIVEATALKHLISIKKKSLDISLDLIPKMLGRIYTFMNSKYHRDIGTVESYKKAQEEFKKLLT